MLSQECDSIYFIGLEVGESFVVPVGEEPRLRRAAANYNAKHKDRKISVRLVAEGLWCGRLV